jgi:hypothetical protein
MLRKGINLKYPSMVKIMKLINFSVVDSIDQGRVNRTYFQLLKSLNLFNSFRKLEPWLLNEDWKNVIIKKVKHRHFTNYNQVRTVREKENESLAVVIPKNADFEIIGSSRYRN